MELTEKDLDGLVFTADGTTPSKLTTLYTINLKEQGSKNIFASDGCSYSYSRAQMLNNLNKGEWRVYNKMYELW